PPAAARRWQRSLRRRQQGPHLLGGVGLGGAMSPYDLVDLWFDMGERLPPELSIIALEMLQAQPSRLDGRCVEAVSRIVEAWKVRFPVPGEVQLVVDVLLPRTEVLRGAKENIDPEKVPLIHLATCFTKAT